MEFKDNDDNRQNVELIIQKETISIEFRFDASIQSRIHL